jgi:hypothetical protein
LKCPRQPVAGLRDANFLAVVLIHRAGNLQQILSADFYHQQICLLQADSFSRFLSSAVFLFVSRFCQQIS